MKATWTLDDISHALERVKAALAEAREERPLLIVYIASHGISEGIAWNQFSLPGTFTYLGKPEELGIEPLSRATLHAATLVDKLEKLKIPFLVILDICYEGKSRSFESEALTATASRSSAAVAQILRHINEFNGPNPVLFATSPGNVVSVAPDPDHPGSRNVGPLARRAMLILDLASRRGRDLSLGEFVAQMASPDLDKLTTPAVTRAKRAGFWSDAIVFPSQFPSRLETSQGTGTKPQPCCNAATGAASQPTAPTVSVPLYGRVELRGAAGEFITSGRKLVLAAPTATMTLDQDGPGNVTINVAHDDKSWAIELSIADGARFAPRKYENAQRNWFNDRGRPGLAIAGDGHSCNEVKGSFTVTDIAYDADSRVKKLSGAALQYCDDVHSVLTVSFDVTARSSR
jgi:hypothetical protein